MLTKAGLTVIDVLTTGREATVAELSTNTEYSKPHLYDIVEQLVADGLLTEQRGPHNQRQIRVTDHPVVETYRTLQSELGHVEWPTLLSPATLRVCWFLDEPRRVADIAARLDITRQSVHKGLDPLKNRAMLSPSGPEYALQHDLSPLLAFTRAVVRHEHRSRARTLAPSATVKWCDPRRALVRVQTSDDTTSLLEDREWQLTGLGRFEEYGLQFFLANEPAFWYGPEEALSAAKIVCHTLALDRGSRRVSYALLLIEKEGIEHDQLTTIAQWYDLQPAVTAMYRWLQDDTDRPEEPPITLPGDTEFSALKEQYGVA
jgi:DNA-binding MarR family transcriptional regulator